MRKSASVTGLFIVFTAAAFGQCTFTVTPSGQAFADSLGYLDTNHDPLVIHVTASSQTCGWTADASDGFATVSGAASGTGNGSVTYSVSANTTAAARSVVLHIAGNAITLTQKATASVFADEPLADPFFDGINLMRTNNITLGCSAAPLSYCPNTNVTRDQMAVFIVRTILGGGPNVDNFQYSSTPYFTDVPPTYQFFKWIQKMRELGITSGSSATTYGPLEPVTRGQMAVFIVRARLGTSTVFTYNPTPYFTDVPANYQFFKWVQKLKEIGITSGTTATTYSPDEVVTRGQMAVFLIRAGFNTLLNPALPLITSAAPNNGAPGTSVSIAVTGINTHFASDTTILADNGVTGGKPVVTDATHLTVTLNIPSGTTLGQISITAETLSANEEATLPNGFTIGTGDPVPTITSFMPASGPIGTSVTLTGNTLVSSLGTPVSVLVPLAGGGLTGAPVESASANSITFVMPSTAASGKITLSSSSGTVTSATSFTVVPSSTYTISATPSTGNVIAGQTATYSVTASSSSGFSGLAQLSVSGLPSGVTGTFNPAQISVGEQSILTISAPSNQATNTASLVISASAVVDGIAEPAATNVTLNVTPITTSFLGRTVVDDAANTSLVGVTVSMIGQDGSGHATACTGSTVSDGSGNFALTNLPTACLGPQLIAFNGNTVTSPAGKYAGLNLVFTVVANTVVVSPVLVHMPRVDNLETFYVKQNAPADQSYSFKSIPGLSVTIYAGTVITAPDGTIPDPYPFSAIKIPIDRLPDALPPTTATVTAFLVSFPPDGTNASQPVAVSFPNTLHTPPGTSMPLMTLNPVLGRVAPYGTGMVSNDGTTIIPDIDPSTGTLYHRFGISHFDWHGPSAPGSPSISGSPDGSSHCACSLDPIDLYSGIQVMTSTDLTLKGGRGSIEIMRTYVTLSSEIHSFGLGGSMNYDYRLDTAQPQSAALINLTLPDGVKLPFARAADGTLTNQNAPSVAGSVMTTAADGTVTLRLRTGAYYKFQPAGSYSVLIEMGDANGNATKIAHDLTTINTPITEIDDPVGRRFVLTNSNGLITSVTDPIGRKVSYSYDTNSNLISVTDVSGGVTTYQYDSQNRLTKVTDPAGVVNLQDTYDANGRVIRQISPSGGINTLSYTLVNPLVPTSPVLQAQVTDANGNTTSYRFNSEGYVVSVTDALGQTRTLERQTGTNYLLSETGNGVCDSCGSTVAGDMTYTYDASGNVLTKTDALGNTITYTYDPVFSTITSVTDAVGSISRRFYDSYGQLIRLTDARGNSLQFTHDRTGLVTSSQDPAGNITAYAYNSFGDLISLTDPLNRRTQFGYDAVSRPISQTDPMGRTYSVTYNQKDEVTQLVDGSGNVTAMTYNVDGLPTSYTDPNGGKTTIAWDSANRISSRTDALNRVTTYQYDLNDNLIGVTNRRKLQATFTYDALNRITSDTYADATVQRQYDLSSRLARVVDSQAGAFDMTWDAAGRLLKVAGPNGTIVYTRDGDGRVVTRQVVGQPAVSYTYDPEGEMTGAAMGSTSVTRTYDARNLMTANVRSNGASGALGFDAAGQMLSIAEQSFGKGLYSRALTYDPAGQIASSALDLGLPLATPGTSASFDAANETTAFGGTTYTSDADGNRLTETTNGATTSYTWDARGRLQAISAPGGVLTSFVYDPGGQMIQMRVTSTGQDNVQRFILDDVSNIVSIQQGSATPTAVLDGRNQDDIIATVQGNSAVFPLMDQIGSEGGFTDASGTVVGREYYEPFGAATASGTASLFQFAGRPRVGNNLFYNRARFYDSTTAAFLSEDPTGLAGGSANLYSYAGGDPVGSSDPTGLDVWVEESPQVAGLHEMFCVGHYSQVRGDNSDAPGTHCYSLNKPPDETFGMWGGTGYVAMNEDIHNYKILPGHFKRTTRGQDAQIKAALDAMKGTGNAYFLLGNNCRTFAQGAFDEVAQTGRLETNSQGAWVSTSLFDSRSSVPTRKRVQDFYNVNFTGEVF